MASGGFGLVAAVVRCRADVVKTRVLCELASEVPLMWSLDVFCMRHRPRLVARSVVSRVKSERRKVVALGSRSSADLCETPRYEGTTVQYYVHLPKITLVRQNPAFIYSYWRYCVYCIVINMVLHSAALSNSSTESL